MRITEEYTDSNTLILRVEKAIHFKDYQIEIHFNDGHSTKVDFGPFLRKSMHPSIKKYLDEGYFSDFQLIDGNINWHDYDLIFPVYDLYTGKI